MEIYGRVRRAVRVEGRSQRAVAREFGLSRETVRKMLQYAVPPGYQRQQPIKRLKNDYRYHFILKSKSRERLNTVLREMITHAVQKKIPRTAVIVDVDALSLM